jgi:hypothetical protein
MLSLARHFLVILVVQRENALAASQVNSWIISVYVQGLVDLEVALWKVGNCTHTRFILSNWKVLSSEQQIVKRSQTLEKMARYSTHQECQLSEHRK